MAANLQSHPTVIRLTERKQPPQPARQEGLDAEWLRRICLEAGADDVGFVAIGRAELDDQRAEILEIFPQAQALISFVCRMNRTPIRTTARSMANLEFHRVSDNVDDVSHQIVALLEQHGIDALNPAVGFPMEVGRFPGKTWIVSHKAESGAGVCGKRLRRRAICTQALPAQNRSPGGQRPARQLD
jgi:hypothetical protein